MTSALEECMQSENDRVKETDTEFAQNFKSSCLAIFAFICSVSSRNSDIL